MSVPDSPNIQIRPRSTPNTLEFWWGAPTNLGGSAITGYTLSCTSPAISITYGPTVRYAKLTGLINRQLYSFRLIATNATGSSLPASFRTVDPGVLTGSPTNVVFTKNTDQSGFTATATWTPPLDISGACAIGWYLFTATPSVGVKVVKATQGYERSRSISGLNPALSYSYTVQAISNAGYSAPFALTVPGQPTNLVATAGNTVARLTWTAPVSDGGQPVINYQYSLNGGTTFVSFNPPFTGTTIDINDLNNGQQYTIVLRAINSVGIGASSASRTVIPSSGGIIPNAPTLQSAIPQASSVRLTWSAPTIGAPFTNYQYSTDGGVTFTMLDPPSLDLSANITGLTNGVLYSFAVKAVNAANVGPSSNILTARPNVKPGVPTGLSATPGDGLATLRWTTPTVGTPFTRFQYSLNSGINWLSFNPDVSGNATSGIVRGLTNRTTYTIVVRSVNSADNSFASDPVQVTPIGSETVPGAPTNLSFTPANLSVTVSWSTPSNGGFPITGYRYALNNDTTYVNFNPVADGTATSGTITGLTNGTSYTVKVIAVNLIGDGQPSSQLSVTPGVLPSVPQNFTATSGNGTVQLGWSAPVSGAPITNYLYSIGGPFIAFSPAITTSPVIRELSGLTNGTSYNVSVRAVNAAFPSGGDPTTAINVTPSTVPERPTNVGAVAGNASATISWSPVTNGGSPITRYQYSFTNVNPTFNNFNPDISGTATSGIVTGLTNGTPYTIYVRAVNVRGNGLLSLTGASVTPTSGATVPGSPTGLASLSDNMSARISWVAPNNGGSPITGYQYAFTNVDASFNNFNSGGAAADNSGTITGLTNGRPYTVFVRARNAVGAGVATGSVQVTPSAVPSTLTNVTAAAGNATATISWSAVNNGGLPITLYEYAFTRVSPIFYNFNPSVTGADTSGIITDLTNDISYTIFVRAVNSRGPGLLPLTGVTFRPTSVATVPGSPTSLAALPGNATARISWVAPNNGGSAIIKYQYSFTNVDAAFIDFTTGGNPTDSSGTITGLTNGTPYTVFVRARNAIGAGVATGPVSVTPATVPGSPTSLAALSGNASARISWVAPANGGSAITRYQYAFTNVDAAFTNFTTGGITTDNSGTITGLINGTSYTVFVRARNAVGAGVAIGSVSVTPATVPGSPTNLAALAGNTTARISWVAPANGGSAITGYQYAFTNVDAAFTNFNTGGTATDNSGTITGLTNGTPYTVFVRARNAAGAGVATGSVSVTPLTVPGSPTGLAALAGNTSARISWIAPANGGSAITGYQYAFTNVDASFNDFNSGGAATDNSGTITGLINGTPYTVFVRARNAAGAGVATGSVSVTPATVPGTPTITTAVGGDTSATITWQSVANGGSVITRYEYSIVSDVSGFTSFNPDVSGTATSGTITGLTNGTNYTVYVRAVNARGNGNASTGFNVRPNVAPSVPLDLSGVGGFQSVSLTWNAPVTGAPFTNYEYSIDNAAFVAFSPVVTGTSASISGLTNGQLYQIRIRAVNAIGPGVTSVKVSLTPSNAQTVPGIPPNVTALAGNTTAKISWSTVNNGGSAITAYQYSTTSATTGFSNFSPNVSGADTSGTITDLTNGTLYTVYLRAVNAVGNGLASTGVTVTPATVPGSPTGLAALAGNASARISWIAPANGGSAITGYEYSTTSATTGFNNFNSGGTATDNSGTITGLTNGTSYTVFVRARNAVGAGVATGSVSVTPVTVPGSPTGLAAVAGNASARISWIAPANGGSAITRYQYAFTNVDASFNDFTTGGITTDNSGTITGLTNGTSYTVFVRARNAVGAGVATGSVSVTPSTVPGRPTNVTALAGNTSATISWSLLDNGGSVVTRYQYSITGQSGTFNNFNPDVSGTTSSGIITGLTNGTPYTVYVRAVNARGDGLPSTTGATVTPTSGATVPAAPTGLTALSGNTSAMISWSPVANGGSPITRYQYSITSDVSGFTSFNPDISGTATSGMITGLTNGTSYTVYVRAVNAVGNGPASTSTSVTPSTVPARPTITTTTPGNASATITWQSVANGGSPITRYQYSIVSDVSGFTSFNPDISGTATTGTITGLTNGTSYTVYVRAVNAVGNGPASTSTSVTPSTVPARPTITTATPGNASATITWENVANGGSVITRYQYSIVSDVSGFTSFNPDISGTTTSGTITGLTNGIDYTVYVRAVNARGNGNASTGAPVTPNVLPSAPRNLSGTGGFQVIDLSWNVPTLGAPFINYQYCLDNSENFTEFEPELTGTSGTISGLTNGRTYQVKLRARNSIGSGDATTNISVTPSAQITVPGAPTNLRGIGGDKSAKITWIPPNNGGSPITAYQYAFINTTTNFVNFDPEVSGSDVSGTIRDLSNGVPYTIFVRAVNVEGPGNASPINVTPNLIIRGINLSQNPPVIGSAVTFTVDISGSYRPGTSEFLMVDNNAVTIEASGSTLESVTYVFSSPNLYRLQYTITTEDDTEIVYDQSVVVVEVSGEPMIFNISRGLEVALDLINFKPPPGYESVSITMTGAPGSGGGGAQQGEDPVSGGGGGGAAYITGYIVSDPLSTYTAVRGSSTSGGAIEGDGYDGGDTILTIRGATTRQVVAGGGKGGKGGKAGVYGAGGIGGVGSGLLPGLTSQSGSEGGNASDDGPGVGGYDGDGSLRAGNGGGPENFGNGAGFGEYIITFSIPEIFIDPNPNPPIKSTVTRFVPNIIGAYTKLSDSWSIDGTPVTGDASGLNHTFGASGEYLVGYSLTTTKGTYSLSQTVYVLGVSGDLIRFHSRDGPVLNFLVPPSYAQIDGYIAGGSGGGAGGRAEIGGAGGGSGAALILTGLAYGTISFFAGTAGARGLANQDGGNGGGSFYRIRDIGLNYQLTIAGGGGGTAEGGGYGGQAQSILGGIGLQGQDGSGTSTTVGGSGGYVGYELSGGNPFNLRGGNGGNVGAAGTAGSAGVFSLVFQQPELPIIRRIENKPDNAVIVGISAGFIADISGTYTYEGDSWFVNETQEAYNTNNNFNYTFDTSGVKIIKYILQTNVGVVQYTQTFFATDTATSDITFNSIYIGDSLRNFTVPSGYSEMDIFLLGGSGGGGGGESSLAVQGTDGAGGGGGGGALIDGTILVQNTDIISISNPVGGPGGNGAAFNQDNPPTRKFFAQNGLQGTDAILTFNRSGDSIYTARAGGGRGGTAGNMANNGTGGLGGTVTVGSFWVSGVTSQNGSAGSNGISTVGGIGGVNAHDSGAGGKGGNSDEPDGGIGNGGDEGRYIVVLRSSQPAVTVPGAPTNLQAVPGDGTATISWTAPNDGGSPITIYQYSINNGANFNLFPSGGGPTDTTGLIEDLSNGVTYQVYVRAENGEGFGAQAGPVSVTPAAAGQSVTFFMNGQPIINPTGIDLSYNETYTISAQVTGYQATRYGWSIKNQDPGGTDGNILNLNGTDTLSNTFFIDLSNSIPLTTSIYNENNQSIRTPLVIEFKIFTDGPTYTFDVTDVQNTYFYATLYPDTSTYEIDYVDEVFPNQTDQLLITKTQGTSFDLSGNLSYRFNDITTSILPSLFSDQSVIPDTDLFSDNAFLSPNPITLVYTIDTYYRYIDRTIAGNTSALPIVVEKSVQLNNPVVLGVDIANPGSFEVGNTINVTAIITLRYNTDVRTATEGDIRGYTGVWTDQNGGDINTGVSGPYNTILAYVAFDASPRQRTYTLKDAENQTVSSQNITLTPNTSPTEPQVVFSINGQPLGNEDINLVYGQPTSINANVTGVTPTGFGWSVKDMGPLGNNGEVLNITGPNATSIPILIDISEAIPLNLSNGIDLSNNLSVPLAIQFTVYTSNNQYNFDITQDVYITLYQDNPQYTIAYSNSIYPNSTQQLLVGITGTGIDLSGNLSFEYPDDTAAGIFTISSSLLPGVPIPISTDIFTDVKFSENANIRLIYNIDTYYTYIRRVIYQQNITPRLESYNTQLKLPSVDISGMIVPSLTVGQASDISAEVVLTYPSSTKLLESGDLAGVAGYWTIDTVQASAEFMSGPYNSILSYTPDDTSAHDLKYTLEGGNGNTPINVTLTVSPAAQPGGV